MKGVNPLMVTLVTLVMMTMGFFIISFFIRPIEKTECEMDSSCLINCTGMFPSPKCKDGKCVCVAMCMSNTSCSYLGKSYSCNNGECIKE